MKDVFGISGGLASAAMGAGGSARCAIVAARVAGLAFGTLRGRGLPRMFCLRAGARLGGIELVLQFVEGGRGVGWAIAWPQNAASSRAGHAWARRVVMGLVTLFAGWDAPFSSGGAGRVRLQLRGWRQFRFAAEGRAPRRLGVISVSAV